jgi:hypothetical protein
MSLGPACPDRGVVRLKLGGFSENQPRPVRPPGGKCKSHWAQRLRLIALSNIASPCYRMQLGVVRFRNVGIVANETPVPGSSPHHLMVISIGNRVYTQNSAPCCRIEAFWPLFLVFENKFALTRTRITRRQLLRQAGATGALALGASGLAAGEELQDQRPRRRPPRNTPKDREPGGGKIRSSARRLHQPAAHPGLQMAEALLDDMAGRNCDFFFNEASPRSGLVRDRAPVVGRSLSRVASIAATGFGLSALCIAAKYNYLRPLDCEQRVEKTLAFLLEECPARARFPLPLH